MLIRTGETPELGTTNNFCHNLTLYFKQCGGSRTFDADPDPTFQAGADPDPKFFS